MNAAPPLMLAPLAGFTDAPFRLLCSQGGAARVYTEMASAAGLAHGSGPTLRLLDTMPGEATVHAQIFGNNEDDIAAATRIVASLKRFAAIDLNTGCPMPRIRAEGSGSALLESPEKIYRMLRAMKAESGGTPITLKTRPGPRPSQENMLEIVACAEEAGVSEIALHARFASRAHGGPPLLDKLAECVKAAKVPVIGNGGVVDRASCEAMAATGVAGIMIGRAALGDPWIFRRLAAPEGEAGDFPDAFETFARHVGLVKEFAAMTNAAHPDIQPVDVDAYVSARFRLHLYRYFAGMRGAAAMRREMNGISSLAGAEAAVAGLAGLRTVS